MTAYDSTALDDAVASTRRGCIIAAAGCGKTEQLVRATALSPGRRLVLTHTHAGVNAIRQRMNEKDISNERYHIDTIAGWALRFATSFPETSGVDWTMPSTNADWRAIYEGASRLVSSGSITRVLLASYSGLFVDEYQDCTEVQHALVCELASYLPTCLFGDPMQAIFGFKEMPVDWNVSVFPSFQMIAELATPWRWKAAGNHALAKWLGTARARLERGLPLELNAMPSCIKWYSLPRNPKDKVRWSTIDSVCRGLRKQGESVVVIGNSANPRSRAAIAQRLAKYGYGNIEPISSEELVASASEIDIGKGKKRLSAVLDFAVKCMTGVGRSEIDLAVASQLGGGKRGQKKFGRIIPQCIEVIKTQSWESILTLLTSINNLEGTRLYRPEMYYSMRSALQLMLTGQYASLSDAIKVTQQTARHIGRIRRLKSVGSTLLVKGLEYDHAVIIDAGELDRNNLYVALTRAKLSITILSETDKLTPKPS